MAERGESREGRKVGSGKLFPNPPFRKRRPVSPWSRSDSKSTVLEHTGETAFKGPDIRTRPEQEKKLLMLDYTWLRGPESSHTKSQEGLAPAGSISLSGQTANARSWTMSRVIVVVGMAWFKTEISCHSNSNCSSPPPPTEASPTQTYGHSRDTLITLVLPASQTWGSEEWGGQKRWKKESILDKNLNPTS